MAARKPIAMLVALFMLGGQARPLSYEVGQVWEYRTRPGDAGSVLKIQEIDTDPAFAKVGPIYHISVIGSHMSNPHMQPTLPHLPVSRATLDASVTRISPTPATFPDIAPGIAEWRRAKGGVFTISVAEIVDLADMQTAHIGE